MNRLVHYFQKECDLPRRYSGDPHPSCSSAESFPRQSWALEVEPYNVFKWFSEAVFITLQRIREPVARLEVVIPQARDDVFQRKSEFALVTADIILKTVGKVMEFFSSQGLVQIPRSLQCGVGQFIRGQVLLTRRLR